ncbi:U4/U6.U5 tri-snRNP-associated protein 1 [Aphelenchoides fujianensis]|nr:U4/U6.U5 tri-snRNP-associated protein 1 [Aphelenchoides fujianensis]
MSSRYSRKRKAGLDEDTSAEAGECVLAGRSSVQSSDFSHDSSPKKRPSRGGKKADNGDSGGGKGDAESMSIEETNRVRAELGLAPLELDDSAAKAGDDAEESQLIAGPGEEIFKEDGVEIVHKPSKNWSDTKTEEKIREKVEIQKQKHKIYSKVLTAAKGLADSDDEAEQDVDNWWESAKARAQKVAQDLDDLDQNAEAEAAALKRKLAKERAARNGQSSARRNAEATAAGLAVGHSKDDFQVGTETILVLDDKHVLDDQDDVLINPNMVDNERHKKNVERRKQKSDYKPYEEEEVDEFGEIKKKGILAKYDEEDSERDRRTKEGFRLNEEGGYDLDREAQAEEMKRRLLMANKKFESLESTKYVLARDFYTEEEMAAFRKPKKKKTDKIRKRKTLKAADLEVAEETEAERAKKAARLAARRREAGDPDAPPADSNGKSAAVKSNGDAEMEDGELNEPDVKPPPAEKWKEPTGGSVDLARIRSLASKLRKDDEEEEEESDEESFGTGLNLGGVVVDDEAEDELQSALEKTRKLKQAEAKPGEDSAKRVHDLLAVYGIKREPKEEEMDAEDVEQPPTEEGGIVIDATDEQYKMIGDIVTFGLAGNRDDNVDYSELVEEHKKITAQQLKELQSKQKESDEESDDDGGSQSELRSQKVRRGRGEDSDMEIEEPDEEEEDAEAKEKSMWKTVGEEEPGPSHRDSGRGGGQRDRNRRKRMEDDDEVYGADYQNVLGEERDVTKGVGAMLRLAAEKGYLDNSNKNRGGDGHLSHLVSKRVARVEQGKMDIEDKYVRKLERMGTTGSGPIRPFVDKRDYTPNVEISYADNRGRLMEGKEAFRVMSWKFHGKKPGKKQIEKRQAQLDKKEKLKKMNSSDTPLGTLEKQLKKQEQTQMPYLLLSGSNQDVGAPLQKD